MHQVVFHPPPPSRGGGTGCYWCGTGLKRIPSYLAYPAPPAPPVHVHQEPGFPGRRGAVFIPRPSWRRAEPLLTPCVGDHIQVELVSDVAPQDHHVCGDLNKSYL